jgi:hypothetical protein
MRRVFRFWVGLLLGSFLVAGCCANNVCECNDTFADALYFRFQVGPDSLTGPDFGRAEVDTIYVLRYPLPVTLPNSGSHDSVAILPTAAREFSDTLFLNNKAPFALAPNRKVNSYEYVILVGDRKRQQFRRYVVNNIRLKGGFEGDGCCTCYINSGKSLSLNDGTETTVYDVTETASKARVIMLHK